MSTSGSIWPTGENWSVEPLYVSYVQALRESKVLYDSQTDHQRLRLFENPIFGRVLTLDGVVQTTERDEFVYHEMITHVPILTHGAAKQVLVIGGGDGGTAREVLRHSSVERCMMVEIDAGVIEFSKEFLPTLSDGCFDNPRLEVVIDDGVAFMANSPEKFDVIIIDSTDPIGPGEGLFTPEFYANAKARLTENGILVTQNGVAFMQPEELVSSLTAFRSLFDEWGCYLAHVPTYAGGPMAMGWGALGTSSREIEQSVIETRFAAAGFETKYYTPAMHKGAFALPPYVSKLFNLD